MKPAKLSAAKKLEPVRIAVYSADDTLSASEALSFISCRIGMANVEDNA